MKRLALAATVTRKQVADAVAAHDWQWVDEYPADAQAPYEQVWSDPSGTCTLHLVEDEIAGMSYLQLEDPHDSASHLLTALHKELPGWTLEEALIATQQGALDRSLACSVLAVLGPISAEPRVLAAVAQLLAETSAQVRMRAVVAAACLGWPEFVPVLTELAEKDPQDYVRWRAADAVTAFRRIGLGGPLA